LLDPARAIRQNSKLNMASKESAPGRKVSGKEKKMTDPKTPPNPILLIVEDSMMCNFLKRLLEMSDFVPEVFGTAKEAAKGAPKSFTAIVLDLPESESKAKREIESVRDRWPGRAVLALVESAAEAEALDLRSCGFAALAKPFANAHFIEVLRRLAEEGRQLGINTPRPCQRPRPLLP